VLKILEETWAFLSGWEGGRQVTLWALAETRVLGHRLQKLGVGKTGTCKECDVTWNDNGWSIPGSLGSAKLPAFVF